MQSIQYSEPAEIQISGTELAEVIALPIANVGSFYQRRGARLPRLGPDVRGTHTRQFLPSPVDEGPDTLMSLFKEYVRINRPAWLPQR